MTNVNSLEDQS